MPTDAEPPAPRRDLDVAPISSIEYARNADRLRILPRLCVSSEGAVDSIQLVSTSAARARANRRGHAGVRDVGRADEGAASGGDARPSGRACRRQTAHRRRRAQVVVRGSDAAPRPRPPLARANRPADGLRGVGRPGTGCRRACSSYRTRSSLPCARHGPSRRPSPTNPTSATATRPAFSRVTSRSSATRSGRASVPAC